MKNILLYNNEKRGTITTENLDNVNREEEWAHFHPMCRTAETG